MSLKCAYFALLMKLESWLPALHPPLNFGTLPPFCRKSFPPLISTASNFLPQQPYPQQHKTTSNHHDAIRPSTLHAHTYRGPRYACRYRRTSAASISDRLYRIPLQSRPRRTRGRFMSRRISHNNAKLPATKKGTQTNHPLLT